MVGGLHSSQHRFRREPVDISAPICLPSLFPVLWTVLSARMACHNARSCLGPVLAPCLGKHNVDGLLAHKADDHLQGRQQGGHKGVHRQRSGRVAGTAGHTEEALQHAVCVTQFATCPRHSSGFQQNVEPMRAAHGRQVDA